MLIFPVPSPISLPSLIKNIPINLIIYSTEIDILPTYNLTHIPTNATLTNISNVLADINETIKTSPKLGLKGFQNINKSQKTTFKDKKRFYSTLEDSGISITEMNNIFFTDNNNNKYLIKSLILKENIKLKPFATMDLETININGNQHPICISSYNGITNENRLFMVDIKLLKTDLNKAINNLFRSYFEYIKVDDFPNIIFIHNLGSFDGYFLYKYLLEYDYINTNCLIDKANEFIEINYSYELNKPSLKNKDKTVNKNIKISFRDSFRIFPVGLDKLCGNFGVDGKFSIIWNLIIFPYLINLIYLIYLRNIVYKIV